MAIVVAFMAPGTASAFVGEGAVLAPSGGTETLSTPAQTILTNPTFLDETYTDATASSAAEGSGFLDMLAGSGMIPELSAALPWVAGATVAAIGTVAVCNAIFGSCLDFGASGTDPSKTEGWVWSKATKLSQETVGTAGVGVGVKHYTVMPGEYVTSEKIVDIEDWEEACGKASGSVHRPPEATTIYAGGTSIGCSPEPKPGLRDAPVRSGSRNRYLHATGSSVPDTTPYAGSAYCTSLESCSSAKPRTDWPVGVAHCLQAPGDCGMTNSQRDKIGEHLAAAVGATGVVDPFGAYVDVPDCDGLYWTQCESVIEEAGLSPSRQKVGFNGADVEKGAGAVLELRPESDVSVRKGSTVTVVTNPDEAEMPVVLPQPLPEETGQHYVHRLALLDPALKVGLVTNAKDDPSYGPEAVTGVEPTPSMRVAHSAKVTVSQNSATAPVPAGAGGWAPPTIPAIDMSPMSGLSPCGVFPFGLFCWIGEAFGQFNTSGTCPHMKVPVSTTYYELSLCGEVSETVMNYVRPAILLVFIVGLGIMFARGTKAVGGED